MLREALVDERVVGRQELVDAQVLAHDVLEQELGLAPHGATQVVVEVRELLDVRPRALQVAQEQPLAREILDERRRSWIGEHAADLLIENALVAQFVLPSELEELVVGRRAPQEEREARRERRVVQRIQRARRDAGRVGLLAEQELRARQNHAQRGLNTGVEAAARGARFVERQQRRDVLLRRLAPESSPRQRRQDLACADVRRRLVGGTACEDP